MIASYYMRYALNSGLLPGFEARGEGKVSCLHFGCLGWALLCRYVSNIEAWLHVKMPHIRKYPTRAYMKLALTPQNIGYLGTESLAH